MGEMYEIDGGSGETLRVFSPTQQQAVTEYVSMLQEVLRVRDWHIDINFTDPSEDAIADMNSPSNQKWATLRLSEDFLELSSQIQTQTLIHEVAHCLSFHIHGTTEEVWKASVRGKHAKAVAEQMLSAFCEQVTDHIADVLLPMVAPFTMPPNDAEPFTVALAS
jgi:hypothetical protein